MNERAWKSVEPLKQQDKVKGQPGVGEGGVDKEKLNHIPPRASEGSYQKRQICISTFHVLRS